MAVLVHALLLSLIRVAHSPYHPTPNPELSVFLLPRLETNSNALPKLGISSSYPKPIIPPHPKPRASLSGNINIQSYPAPTVTTLVPGKKEEPQETPPTAVNPDRPQVNIQQLLEKAHQIAGDEGHLLEKLQPLTENMHPGGQPMLAAAIGKAFESGQPQGRQKITQLADGTIEVVTAYGTKYCLTPAREFQKGGPVEAMALPGNCP